MSVSRTWHAGEGSKSYTLNMRRGSVQFSSGGPGPYDSGGATFSHAEFREGHFHDDIERHFGSAVLKEALSLLVDVSRDPLGGAEGEKRQQVEAWNRVKVDESLATLAENGDEYGSQRFHLADAATATTNGHSLSMDHHTATITGPEQQTFAVAKQLSFTALLAHDGRFFLAANNHAYVFDTAGSLVTSTEHLVDIYGISNEVRVKDVIRSGADIAFAFAPFGGGLDPFVKLLGLSGTFRLSDDGELTARCRHSRHAATQRATRPSGSHQYTVPS